MSLFSFSRFFNSMTKLYKSFETKLSARLRRLEESICRYIDHGSSVEKAVDGVLEKERFFDAVTKEITSGVARAAVNGHNVLPQKQPDTTREEEKLLEAMQDEKPVRISSQLQRRLSKKLADTPWNADDMKLSERLHSGRVRSEIIDTVRSGLRNAATIGQLSKKLYDGYGNGGVLSEADMPKYLKKLINCAKLALGENSDKKAELLALAKSLKANTDKLQTKELKIAYQNLLAVCTSPELKKEALQQAIYTAVQEKTRYHAMRIARSEFQRAWFQGLLARYEDNELLFGWQWNLSSRHKYVRFDQCDVIANADMGYGKGIYPKNKVPFIPRHPHCGCTVVPVFEMQVNTKKRFRAEKARNYIDSLEDWQKQILFGKDGIQAYESGTDWQKLLRGWDGFGKAKPVLEKSDFASEEVTDIAKIKEELAKQLDKLTPQEREKVTGYTGFGAQTINSAIANHRIKPKVQADIDILDNAVGKGVIPFAMRVIRKTIPEYLNAFPKGTKITHDMIMDLKDETLFLEIFASTAIEEFEYQGRNVYIELEVPAGYRGALYIAPIAHEKYRYQNELLFHRNLWYKILSVKFENGIYYMKARVLVDG